jgi:hypothetical protein
VLPAICSQYVHELSATSDIFRLSRRTQGPHRHSNLERYEKQQFYVLEVSIEALAGETPLQYRRVACKPSSLCVHNMHLLSNANIAAMSSSANSGQACPVLH